MHFQALFEDLSPRIWNVFSSRDHAHGTKSARKSKNFLSPPVRKNVNRKSMVLGSEHIFASCRTETPARLKWDILMSVCMCVTIF